MIKTFYVIHDSDYTTGENYTYHMIEMDSDKEKITEDTILEKLNKNYKNEGCNIKNWALYNTFYEIYQDCSESEEIIDDDSIIYELTDTPSDKFINILSAMEETYNEDDYYSVEDQVSTIAEYYSKYGCVTDVNAVIRV